MSHSQSRYQQDLGFPDGIISIEPLSFVNFGAQSSVLTRNAAGDISHNLAAASSAILTSNFNDGVIFRTGFGEDLQETLPGTQSPSAQPQIYRPDLIPAMSALQEITPRTGNKVKGIKFISVALKYLISTNPLTSINVRIDKTVMANNAALAITSILANGANGLQTAIQANPYVTEIPLTGQIYQVTDLSDFWLELAVVTPASSTFRLYGARLKVEFNFN